MLMMVRLLSFLVVGLFATVSSQAEPMIMTCSSEFDETATIKLIIDSSGALQSIETSGTLSWTFDPTLEHATTYRDPFEVLDHTNLMAELTQLANPSGLPVAGAFLSLVASRWTQNSSLEEKLEIISDDSSGLIFLELWDGNGAVVGNALSWGWAGNFTNCR